MKKISFSASLALSANHASVSADDIKQSLSHLGVATIGELESSDASGLSNYAWVHFDTDVGGSYLLVASPSDLSGVELNHKQVTFLKEHGICVDVIAAYFDEGGNCEPPIADGDRRAMSNLIAKYGFSVDARQFVFSCHSDGELGIEQYWLKVMLPDGIDVSSI